MGQTVLEVEQTAEASQQSGEMLTSLRGSGAVQVVATRQPPCPAEHRYQDRLTLTTNQAKRASEAGTTRKGRARKAMKGG